LDEKLYVILHSKQVTQRVVYFNVSFMSSTRIFAASNILQRYKVKLNWALVLWPLM